MLHLDGLLPVEPPRPLTDFEIQAPTATVTRLEWPIFEAAVEAVCGSDFAALPVLDGSDAQQQAYIRDLLQWAVEDDLLGPADGPYEEIIGMSVRDRYLVGKLAPPDTQVPEDQVQELPDAATDSPEGDGKETDASTSQSLVPSCFGFTFCVDGSVTAVELQSGWGRYERTESERIDEKTEKPFRCWKRIPSGGTTTISLDRRTVAPFLVDESCPEVVVQGTVGEPLPNGDRLVTLFLVNNQTKPEQNQDQAWVFQPELIVRDPKGRAIFRKRPLLSDIGSDEERKSLEMIYRRRVEFAVGHGVSVHAVPSAEDPERAVEVRTRVLPRYEVGVTETPGTAPEDRPAMRQLATKGALDMMRLAEMERDELVSTLDSLTDDYASWIAEQRAKIGAEIQGFDASATMAMDRCDSILARLREGISVLGTEDNALEAFRFANRAMALQRVHSVYSLRVRRGETIDLTSVDTLSNRSWRPFQLAFFLLSLPALTDPMHRDRTEPVEAYADLLWFPTGGGKTEAYLGVAAFTMAIRILQGSLGGLDGSRGLAVIMRYTLRLLTIQQFQRATTLMCAMEVLRRGDTAKWGTTPFTIGLWVGQRVTPNTTEESHEAIERERDGKYGTGSSPAQLTFCPWCGSEIVPGRDIRVERDIGRTFIYCGDKYSQCEFGKAKSPNLGLPTLVVDDEIYRNPPSMLIATVDKFAMMAWRGQVRTLFGRATRECPRHGLVWPGADCTGNHKKKRSLPATTVRAIAQIRPPDLIIQDEFHLISGPLGTMVGLYETAVDDLCSWVLEGKTVKPKVVASTATVRKADEQVNNVFLRRVAVFPPHGVDVEDNFFSVQRSIVDRPGRRYMGICSPGSSRPAILIRVYVALLTAAQALFERFGQVADPYMTLVGYFNSLRELGGMRRLAEDDVQTRSYRVLMGDVLRPGLSQRSVRNVDELTSRVSNKDIPKKLDQLEIKFKATWARDETRAIDIVLATNMLSVGVDVNRLGLMVVNGQPKNTAEYIQATSRVGRVFPGLVCTVLTWARPRDLSHYETFEHYHATFYKHIEAQSVTPFAPRALDRGLMGTMVSVMRLENEPLTPNLGAQTLDSSGRAEVAAIRQVVSDRAWRVKDNAARQRAEAMVADRIDRWVNEAVKPGRRLGYERGKDDVAGLLRKPGGTAWDEFTVPFSMREVEPGVRLVMDLAKFEDPPQWRPRPRDGESDGGKE
ncbi:MAG: helicase [Deltaproteobacteria bacterium HGW-Deltaproteobacteria-15]|nr:MAG: helicase [Deltaproteobacteria bacterium HGW-Deltaproteobacteria-15]